MGVVKTALGLMGLAALGLGAYEVAHTVQSAFQPDHPNNSTPQVQTIQWTPHKIIPLNNNSGGTNPPPANSGGNPPSSSSPVDANSLNWAGIVQQGSNETSVQASWTAPNFSTTAADPNSAIAEWIGLGGVQSDSLIQIGTITSPNSSGQATTTVFWENLPASAVQVATVPTGSNITAKIEPVGNDQWRLWLALQGQSAPLIDKVVQLSASQASAVESSADWITEAPTTNGGTAPLAPVGATTMTNVKANGIPLSQMSASSLQTIGLFNATGQIMAEPATDTADDSITVNTIYGSNPPSSSSSSPGGGTWVIQQPGFTGGYGPSYGGGYGGGWSGGWAPQSGYSYPGGNWNPNF